MESKATTKMLYKEEETFVVILCFMSKSALAYLLWIRGRLGYWALVSKDLKFNPSAKPFGGENW